MRHSLWSFSGSWFTDALGWNKWLLPSTLFILLWHEAFLPPQSTFFSILTISTFFIPLLRFLKSSVLQRLGSGTWKHLFHRSSGNSSGAGGLMRQPWCIPELFAESECQLGWQRQSHLHAAHPASEHNAESHALHEVLFPLSVWETYLHRCDLSAGKDPDLCWLFVKISLPVMRC